MAQYKVNYVGYARVSSKGQNLARQIKALSNDGVAPKNIYKEKISGAHAKNRPQLQQMLKDINRTNVVEVVALDRLGRNANDIHKIVDDIKRKGATLQVLNLPTFKGVKDKNIRGLLDDMIIDLFSWQAEAERKEIRSRQRQGIDIAKKNGVYKGRPAKFTNANPEVKRAFTRFLQMKMENLNVTMKEIARMAGMSKRTLYRKINQYHVIANANKYLTKKDYKEWMLHRKIEHEHVDLRKCE